MKELKEENKNKKRNTHKNALIQSDVRWVKIRLVSLRICVQDGFTFNCNE